MNTLDIIQAKMNALDYSFIEVKLISMELTANELKANIERLTASQNNNTSKTLY